MAKAKARALDVRSLVIVSDLHCGCRMGLWPCDSDLTLDGGVGWYGGGFVHVDTGRGLGPMRRWRY